jgi:hypothetical protein
MAVASPATSALRTLLPRCLARSLANPPAKPPTTGAPPSEVFARRYDHGGGAGQALMAAFERRAAGQGCVLAALASRRAAPFHRALGYPEPALYLRKRLEGKATK